MPDERQDLEAFAENTAELDEMRRERDTALRKADKATRKHAALTEAVYQAAAEAVADLRIPPVPKPKGDARKSTEVAVCVLSDWQLAKVTPSYNSATCAERMETYARKVEKLTAIQRKAKAVKECRVYLLGDLVEGELIFPGQSHLIDASLYRQVVVDGPRILADFLRRMAALFEKVHVVGVIGNHGSLGGRARKDYHPESNADAMMYEVCRLITQGEKRITWAPNSTPGERHWYATDTIGGTTFFMFHGDQVKGGFAGWPWYGFGKKLLGWKAMYGFHYSLSGHFHTPVRFKVAQGTHWGNGTTESENTYAAEMLAAQGEPSQWLLYVNPTADDPHRSVTAEFEVHL